MSLQKICHWLEENALSVIGALVLLFFARTVTFDFVGLDDSLLVYENARVTTFSMQTIKLIFSTFDPELYVPLTLLTYQIEYALVGASPWLFHLTNVLLHLTASLLVFRCLELITEKRLLSLAAACIFAIHPLNTETVAWIAARKDLLSGTLLLGSLYYYLVHERDGYTLYPLRSIALFTLALLAKVTVAPFPLFLVLWQWQGGHSLDRNFWKKVSPYFFLSFFFGFIALVGKSVNIATLTPWEQLLILFKSFVHFIRQFIGPFDIRVLYIQHPDISLSSPEFWVPVLIVIALFFLLFSLRKKRLVFISVVSAALFFAPTFATFTRNSYLAFSSDRYAYIPLFFLLLGLIGLSKDMPRLVKTLMILLLAMCAITTWPLVSTWQHSGTLYHHGLRFEPDSGFLRTNLGVHYYKEERIDEAVEELNKAIYLNPLQLYAYINLGNIYQEMGEMELAESIYRSGSVAADNVPVRNDTDLLPYYYYGELLEESNRTEEALVQFEKAQKRLPDSPDANFNLGLKYQKRRNQQQAYLYLKKATEQRRDFIPAMYHLASAAGELAKLDEMVELLERIERVSPGYKKTRYHLNQVKRMIDK